MNSAVRDRVQSFSMDLFHVSLHGSLKFSPDNNLVIIPLILKHLMPADES